MPKKREKSPFEKSRQAEMEYARSLRGIAREVARIIETLDPLRPDSIGRVDQALRRYSEALQPWAKAKATSMLARIDWQDERAWRRAAGDISKALKAEAMTAKTGATFKELLNYQVGLITSLPTEAAKRVHKLTQELVIGGGRSSEIVEEIRRSGHVTKARATLIARTETARAAATFTQVRAEHIGSQGYIWRTSHDGDVRPSHKKMEGKFVPWDTPPTLDNLTGHAGCLPNCRCFPEPVIPEHLG